MNRLAWAVPFLILAACAAWAWSAGPPGRRALRGWRERAAWRRITRANPDLERRFTEAWEEDIVRLQGEIAETLRRIRDCTEGGDG